MIRISSSLISTSHNLPNNFFGLQITHLIYFLTYEHMSFSHTIKSMIDEEVGTVNRSPHLTPNVFSLGLLLQLCRSSLVGTTASGGHGCFRWSVVRLCSC
jgi:hypothetical protein